MTSQASTQRRRTSGPEAGMCAVPSAWTRLLAAVALVAGLSSGQVSAQEPMQFPSFNSAFSKPQGQPAAPDAPAAPRPKPAAAAKKPKPAKTEVAASSDNSPAAKAAEARGMSIAVLVDDQPITGYEIDQRQKLIGLSANLGQKAQDAFKRLIQNPATSEHLKAILGEIIKANPGKSREEIIAIFEERKKQYAMSLQKQAVDQARSSILPTLRKTALDELIDERLKLNEAKRLNVMASEEDVNRVIHNLAEKNKMTDAQFAQHVAGMGADIEGMRARFRATLSWNDVIRKQFGYRVSVSGRDVDRLAAQSASGEDTVEVQVQRLTLSIPEKINQKLVASRMAEAETVRSKFTGCKTMQSLAGAVANAKFDDLGMRKPSTLTEPTKSLIVSAKDGEMLPPVVGPGGVELYAVCSRQALKADDQKRSAALEELRSKEFDMYAKRHLQDLREKATIDYRQSQ